MPELLTLVACEKVIIDEQKNPSLIVLMEHIEAQIPEGQSMPPDVMAPIQWTVFTLWKKQDGEELGHCKQFIDIAPPGNLPTVRFQTEFDFTDRLHKIVQRIIGIPVGVPGTCWVKVRLEFSTGVTETFSYPLEIVHKFVPVALLSEGAVSETSAP